MGSRVTVGLVLMSVALLLSLLQSAMAGTCDDQLTFSDSVIQAAVSRGMSAVKLPIMKCYSVAYIDLQASESVGMPRCSLFMCLITRAAVILVSRMTISPQWVLTCC
jgi:hypothetical protein